MSSAKAADAKLQVQLSTQGSTQTDKIREETIMLDLINYGNGIT